MKKPNINVKRSIINMISIILPHCSCHRAAERRKDEGISTKFMLNRHLDYYLFGIGINRGIFYSLFKNQEYNDSLYGPYNNRSVH